MSTVYVVYETRKDAETNKPRLVRAVATFNSKSGKEQAKNKAAQLRKGRDGEARRHGDSYVVKTLTGGEANEVVRQKQRDKMVEAILRDAECEGPAAVAFTKALLRDNQFTDDELYHWNFDHACIEETSNEYISRSTSSSVRTWYVSGTLVVCDKSYSISGVPYKSDVNRV
ncbi:MAG: hypothetical protein LC687_00225 [Actinobacteria bacterium]|nr:hypothetical protein [Actinomycetota bacterium]MCA1806296.1 hypothetical protein [Actinomycetota bacterium]